MIILKKETAPRYKRKEGITSHLLVSPRTCDAEYLATTMVEIIPGGQQRIHSHVSEQIYYISTWTKLLPYFSTTYSLSF